MNKRFLKEIKTLYLEQSQKPLLENDYLIYHDENDINILHTIIKAPRDSVYRHKFIRLDFKIPDDYPHSPPKVTFINYDSVRIHPNMYEDGKCCSTILNTWPSENEKWTSSMGIETILLTFHSFLDNNPYTYEPGGRDDQSYSVYVRFQSWITLLIRYLQYEKIESFRQFIYSYLLSNIDPIFSELNECKEIYNRGYYYTRCFNIEYYQIDYNAVSEKLQDYYNYIDFSEITEEEITFEMFLNKEFNCSICFDTFNEEQQGTFNENEFINLECTHQFHKSCLNQHTENNGEICPMCRTGINLIQQREQNDIWMTNPLTKRKIKIGGKTYTELKKLKLI